MSWVHIKPDEFDKEIKNILRDNKEQTVEAVNNIAYEEAKTVVRELRAISKAKFGKGPYQKGWTKKIQKVKEGYKRYICHNKTQYRLTHLLENGHVKVLWGRRTEERVEGREHILPIANKAESEYYNKVKARLAK